MEIKIVKDPMSRQELSTIASVQFGDMVKAVVDVAQGIMAIGGELHADEEVALMEQAGSKREHTWGINLYPKKSADDWLEFNSMINIKPALGNRSRGVEDVTIQKKIKEIVTALIPL
jgi:hypothetical protein